ncbi:MAG: class I SAM-dependent methyltransferase family protein, partial [Nanoarchaeota archaeon]|nr:class I SAM-dependent methyltransferase family protein [Nanoarchaeota archaeon]
MLSIKTELKNAQRVKKSLLDKGLLDLRYVAKRKGDFICFPITKAVKIAQTQIVNTKLEKKKERLSLENLLKRKLTTSELKIIPKTQEIVGDIMILEIPEKLEKKEKIIAEAYLELTKNVKTVVKKSEIHSGIFRTRKLKVLAGIRNKTTIHLENGVRIKLNLEKSYFSARLGNERLRIAKLVKKGEEILVMFSGSAPYPLVLAKHSPVKTILGIEINPDAHQFGLENLKLNKLENKIKLINGDVRKIIPKLSRGLVKTKEYKEYKNKKFDRILMPLPKTGEEFLDVALPITKKGGYVHLYA